MIQHHLLQDINKQMASLDETKPIVFIDVDGVLNPLPYQREWIGPEHDGFSGWWDAELSDPKNWKVVQLEPDLSTDYAITRQVNVEMDSWASSYDLEWSKAQDPEEKRRFRTFRMSFADEMLDSLRRIIEDAGAQIVYLTFWKSEALRLIEPEVKLGGKLFLDWWTGSDRGHILKIDSIRDLFEEADIRTPFIVIDDESVRGLTSTTPLWHVNEESSVTERTARRRELNEIPRLIIQPNSLWGINREHIREITDFLDKKI